LRAAGNVDDTVNGLRLTYARYRTRYGCRRRQGELNGFQVTHFADQNNVRVFAQRRTQGVGERLGVRPKLTLVDQTFFRLMDEFDGINVKTWPLLRTR
jgi:hypothetical protein